MSWKKKLFHQTVQHIPVGWLKKFSKQDLCCSFQHIISDEPAPHIRHLYGYKNVKQFENDIDYLLKHFYPVHLTEVLKHYKEGYPLPENSFLLTFDDGLREVYDIIAPILLRKGVPSVFFINSAFLDNETLFFKFKISLVIDALKNKSFTQAQLNHIHFILNSAEGPADNSSTLIKPLLDINYNNRQVLEDIGETLEVDFDNFLKTYKPFMSAGQVETLIQQGFSVGAHSIDHPYYKIIPLEEQVRQTRDSMFFVKEKFKLPYSVFAFPHLDESVSQQFFDTMPSSTENGAVDLYFGEGNMKKELKNLIVHRFNGERPQLTAEQAYKSIILYSNVLKFTKTNVFIRKN